MYGFGIARLANPTAGGDPAFGTGRFGVPGIVRTGGSADSDGVRDDSMVFVDPTSGQVVVVPQAVGSDPVPPVVPPYIPTPGASMLPAVTPPVLAPPASSGFSISDVPWWGWAAGAGALFFMMKGGR